MMEENLNQFNNPSREEWRFPLLARFKNWVIGFGAAAVLILAALYGAYLVMRPAAVVDTQPAIAVVANPATFPDKKIPAKTATKNKAAQAINTPAIAINMPTNSPEIPPSAPAAEPLTPAEQDFEKRLAIFESKTP